MYNGWISYSMMSHVLDQLRKAIATSPKTRYRLWQETGIGQPQLSRLMNGRDCLGYGNLDKLSDALGMEFVLRPKSKKRS